MIKSQNDDGVLASFQTSYATFYSSSTRLPFVRFGRNEVDNGRDVSIHSLKKTVTIRYHNIPAKTDSSGTHLETNMAHLESTRFSHELPKRLSTPTMTKVAHAIPYTITTNANLQNHKCSFFASNGVTLKLPSRTNYSLICENRLELEIIRR